MSGHSHAEALGKALKAKGIKAKTRYTWKNTTSTQKTQPLQYVTPKSRQDLVDIVQLAEKYNYRVRALGSSLSFSDCAVTNDILLNTHKLDNILDLQADVLKDDADENHLVRVECGIRIRNLNILLDRMNLALVNMGGYTAQTIVGVTSTSTHGTGIKLGPLSDLVEAMEIVGEGGKVYRVESTKGISDPILFKAQYPDIELIQDDDFLYSCRVSMGSTGIVYSVILRVVDRFFLCENRKYMKWDDVKHELETTNVLYDHDHFEVIISPYKIKGDIYCIRYTMDKIDPEKTSKHRGWRRILPAIAALIPGAHAVLIFILNRFPSIMPSFLKGALQALIDKNYINISYKVLDLGAANAISAYSSEIGFPVENGNYIKAADRIIELAEANRKNGNVYQTSPFALRFVKASPSYLSMQYGYDTCMIEMPIVNGTIGGMDILERYEDAMYDLTGRPHWGQVNFISGGKNFIETLYPKYKQWLKVFEFFNKKGTFSNKFTDRMGFSTQGPFVPYEKGES